MAVYPTVTGCLVGRPDMIALGGWLFSLAFWTFFFIGRMDWLNAEIAALFQEDPGYLVRLPSWNRMVFSVWVWDIKAFLKEIK